MLEKVDLTKKLDKESYKEQIEGLQTHLGALQRECKELGIPIMIVFEGLPAAGKGFQMGKLIQALDPRGFEVHNIGYETKDEARHPFLWRFWKRTPAKGMVAIYDGSWYHKVSREYFDGYVKGKKVEEAYEELRLFEKELTVDGTLIVKFFLYIDKEEQRRRMNKLLSKESTRFRVNKNDKKRHIKFDRYRNICEKMLQKTDTEYAPWEVIPAMDKRYTTVKIYKTVIAYMEQKIDAVKRASQTQIYQGKKSDYVVPVLNVLGEADLTLAYTREDYKKYLKVLQKKIEKLHGELYHRRIPLVIGFEGWDAGGKGGAIKRLTEHMDPRGYVVHPTASPNDIEKAHHYLWRFWNDMPKDGHVTIFDRTWYGRVMVERIEGYCSDKEWQRAYDEINHMENSLVNNGAIVLKFWMQIDKEEQERRFNERMNNPEKQYKITDEDWRNREKWNQYEEAVNEMIVKTSKKNAPWIIVEGNNKYYARIKVLETVIAAIEKRLS